MTVVAGEEVPNGTRIVGRQCAVKIVLFGTYPETSMSSLKRILLNNEIGFGYRIGYLFNHYAGPVYKWSAAEFRLHRPEFATMFCAVHLDDASASDVVALSGIPKNSVSRAVARLIDHGLLKREQHERDGRKAILRLTKKGRKIYDDMLPQFVTRQERMLAVLDPAEIREFDRLLDKLVERDDDWATDF